MFQWELLGPMLEQKNENSSSSKIPNINKCQNPQKSLKKHQRTWNISKGTLKNMMSQKELKRFLDILDYSNCALYSGRN